MCQYFGPNHFLLSLSHGLLQMAAETGHAGAARIARNNFNWITGANPYGSSFIVGCGEDPVIQPWGRSYADSIGGALPGPLLIDGKLTLVVTPEYNGWMVSETGIGNGGCSLFTVLALLDKLDRKGI